MNPKSLSFIRTAEKLRGSSRIASAAVTLPPLALIVWIGSPWFTVLVAAMAAVGAMELCGMASRWGDRPYTQVAVLWAVAFVVAGHFVDSDSSLAWALPIVGIAAAISLASMLWCHGSGTRLSSWGVTTGAALYTGGLLFYFPLLRDLEQGLQWVVLLLLVTFVADTCAFVVGRAIGRRPLAPSISPSKTWEGTIGGLLGALGASAAAVVLLDLDAGIGQALGLGALMGTVGPLGDLVESRLKRIAGVDNSGWLLPGHGGILDRLDSIVFNLVVVYYFVS